MCLVVTERVIALEEQIPLCTYPATLDVPHSLRSGNRNHSAEAHRNASCLRVAELGSHPDWSLDGVSAVQRRAMVSEAPVGSLLL